jgi:serpin B
MLQKTTKINELSRLFLTAKIAEAKSKGLENKNALVSSISLYYALAILKNGAAGETEKKLAEVLLKSTGYNSNEVSQRLADLITQPAAADTANGTDGKVGSFVLANSAWASLNLKFMFAPNFLDALKQSFKGESTSLDFTNSVSADVINKWVKGSTNGQIPEIINASTLSELQWVIINAAAFEGSWQQAGQKIDLNFAFPDGNRKEVPGVRHSAQDVKFLEVGTGGLLVAVPFKGDKYSLIFRLSPSAGTMPTLGQQLPELMGSPSLKASIDFPKFSFEDEVSMTSGSSIAKELGLEELFASPNLTKLGAENSPARAVGLIKQKAKIELDQFGVKASAATVVTSAKSLAAPKVDRTVLIDRPFGFAIIENTSQTILFNGVVLDPTAK